MGTTARLDRVVLTLLGLLLTAAGVLALLVGFGVFGDRLRERPVFDNLVGRYFSDNGTWLWPVIALVVLLLAYLALRWLIGQLRPTRTGDLQLEPHGADGRTTLASGALTGAVAGEIRDYRGVTGASARLVGENTDPRLHLRVQLDSRADVAALRRRIEDSAVAHVRAAMDDPDLPVRLDLVVTDKKAPRVS